MLIFVITVFAISYAIYGVTDFFKQKNATAKKIKALMDVDLNLKISEYVIGAKLLFPKRYSTQNVNKIIKELETLESYNISKTAKLNGLSLLIDNIKQERLSVTKAERILSFAKKIRDREQIKC